MVEHPGNPETPKSDLELCRIVGTQPWDPGGQRAAGRIWERHGEMIERHVSALTGKRCPRWVAPEEFKVELLGSFQSKFMTEGSCLAKYHGRGNFEGFLKLSCAHLAVDVARSHSVRQNDRSMVARPGLGAVSLDDPETDVKGRLPVPGPVEPEDVIAGRQAWKRLAESVRTGRLDPKMALVLRMRVVDEHSWSEIAGHFGITTKTAQRWHGQALEVLRGALR